MEERATSARYVSLVTQWGKKLSEAIHKLRQQEDIISSLKREKFELAEQHGASESKIRKLEEEKAALVTHHCEEKERLKKEFENQLSKKAMEDARFQEDKSKLVLLKSQLKVARNKVVSSGSELSSCYNKIRELQESIANLEKELGETKRIKLNVEGELQRMKNGMDKLEETFASLDGQNGERSVNHEDSNDELPPVMEIESLELERESSTLTPAMHESSLEPQRHASFSEMNYRMAESSSPKSRRSSPAPLSHTRHFRTFRNDVDQEKTRRPGLSIYDPERKLRCRICQQMFHRLSLLKEHLRVEHNKKTVGSFGCISCGVPFSNRFQWNEHRRQFHSQQVSKPEYMPDPRLIRGSYMRYKR
ncbi:unnamed protein product [Orchesella dallaii]|uniref:C2H2-type domain-containing protein n=1 Tax=Orchesella dallaii TaxID=48710 RepID=A0ABP1RB44_9HEXA